MDQEPASFRRFRPEGSGGRSKELISTQRAQHPLIEEYTLSVRGLNIMI